MKRATNKPKGCVVFNKLRNTWNFLWCEGNKRKSVKLGTLTDLPTKDDALRKLQQKWAVTTVSQLVDDYRAEKMPERASTRRGYEVFLKNYILPKWQDSRITKLQARPVELWLRKLKLAPKKQGAYSRTDSCSMGVLDVAG